MKSSIFVCLLLLGLLGPAISKPDQSQVPYLVALYKNSKYIGDGALISSTELLVTASSVYYDQEPAKYQVAYWFQLDSYLSITEINIHPSYEPDSYDYDVAILTLASPIDSSGAVPISLPTSQPSTDEQPEVIGWGTIAIDGIHSNAAPIVASVNLISNDDCEDGLDDSPEKIKLTHRMLCTTNISPDYTCSADLGSPLTFDNQLIGLRSWSNQLCMGAAFPNAYSDIYQLSDWITSELN